MLIPSGACRAKHFIGRMRLLRHNDDRYIRHSYRTGGGCTFCPMEVRVDAEEQPYFKWCVLHKFIDLGPRTCATFSLYFGFDFTAWTATDFKCVFTLIDGRENLHTARGMPVDDISLDHHIVRLTAPSRAYRGRRVYHSKRSGVLSNSPTP